jgi:mannonate dehydratase
MNRCHAFHLFTAGGALAGAPSELAAQAACGLPALKITGVRTILTQPGPDHLVVVKVLASEPGLYGICCATHRERPLAVPA